MIADVNKQHRRAFELGQVWDRFFPSLKGKASIEFWMVQLEDFTINTLGQAIKQLARRRLTQAMTLTEMYSYISQISKVITADRVERGLESNLIYGSSVEHTEERAEAQHLRAQAKAMGAQDKGVDINSCAQVREFLKKAGATQQTESQAAQTEEK
jgi:hypothetical protein